MYASQPARRMPSWRRELALAAASALILPFAWNDSMAQGPASAATRTAQGTVRRMTTAPMGEIDGAVLDNETVLHWPPHLSERFTAIVATGDRVRAVGWMETGPDGDTHLETQTITNLRTNAARENDAPPLGPGPRSGPLPPPPPRRVLRLENEPAAANSRVVQGTVGRLTTAPMGEIDGAVLDDGNVIHWPPHMADRFTPVVVKGDRVEFKGWTETGPAGDVRFEVQTATNLRTNASVRSELGDPLPPRPLRSAPGSSRDFESNPAPVESVERRLQALEDQIAQLRDEIRRFRDEL
jgi:hypothetical protein